VVEELVAVDFEKKVAAATRIARNLSLLKQGQELVQASTPGFASLIISSAAHGFEIWKPSICEKEKENVCIKKSWIKICRLSRACYSAVPYRHLQVLL
jgi:hypothetical protein